MTKLGLLFFGRLEDEKGFDAIVSMIRYFAKKNKEIPFELFVFGEGKYEDVIVDLSEKYKEIHYFGYQSQSTIYRYVQNCQYCLMPSEFLETFGLTALESLRQGLPVVGYKKGGLDPFIFDPLNLFSFNGKNTTERLITFVHTISDVVSLKAWEVLRKKSIKISDDYHLVEWEKKFVKFFPSSAKKILLVTDFVGKIGGIENYVRMSSSVINGMGKEAVVLGAWSPSGWAAKIWRYFGLFLSWFNVVFAVRLLFNIYKYKPDVIWFNSTIRWIGWLGYTFSKIRPQTKVWMMFHDFGYFYPFPNSLDKFENIKLPLQIKTFIKSSGVGIFGKIFVLGKYFGLWMLKKVAKKNVDIFFVPSQYMKSIAENSWEISKSKVKVFEHFVG